jgi:hypothetical protein
MSKIIRIENRCPPWCQEMHHNLHRYSMLNGSGGSLHCHSVGNFLYTKDQYDWFEICLYSRKCVLKKLEDF